MIDKRHEELISAYLDGELSAEEQQQVEELLAASAEARQLLDELRALSQTLQAMPRRRVRQDLGAKILRAAERTMLTGASQAGAAVAPPEEMPRDSESRVGLPTGRRWRVLGWPAAAVAASLLLLIATRQVIPDRDATEPREVAKAPARDEPADAEKEVAPTARAARAEKRADALRLSEGQNSDAGLAGGKLAPPAAAPLADEASDDMLVVQVDVSSDAARAGAFQEVLARNTIAWERQDQNEALRLGRTLAKLDQTKSLVAQVETPRPAKSAGRQAASGVEMVYVEATADQIEGTLAELAAQPAQYPAVSVEPAPGIPSQQPLAGYNRRSGDYSMRKKANGYAVKDLSDDKPSSYRASKTEAPGPQFADERKSKSSRGEADGLATKPAELSTAPKAQLRRQASAPAVQEESQQLGQRAAGRARWVQLPADANAADQDELNRSRETLVDKTGETEVWTNHSAKPSASETAPEAMRVLFVFRVVEPDPAGAAGGEAPR